MKDYFKILAQGLRFRGPVSLALGGILLFNLMSVFSLALIVPFLEILFANAAQPPPVEPLVWYSTGSLKAHAYYFLYTEMQAAGKETVLYYFCGVLVVAILLKNSFRYLAQWNMVAIEQGIVERIRNHIFDHLTRLSLAFYTRKRKGELLNYVVNDTLVVQEGIIGMLMSFFSDPLSMVIILGGMLFISWKLTLFSIIVLPLTGLLIDRLSKTLKRRARKGQDVLDTLISAVDEFIGGIRVVKAFNAEEQERKKYRRANFQFTRAMMGFRRRSELASPTVEVLSVLVVIGIILYGALLILNKDASLKPSEFIGFLVLFSQFLLPLKNFSRTVSHIQKCVASNQRIQGLLDEAQLATESESGALVSDFRESLRLEGLSFRYEAKDVLQDLSFEIRKGETVALVGHSGSGKSTLADLLCRFYDPTGGRLLIDGVDVAGVQGKSLRRLMGIVSQEAILFNDTVRNNIAFGAERAYKDAEIEEAARVAFAHDFILNMEQGYATMVGERGARLSGGQRQRLSIARAVLKNPPILILDEATSALDNESEKYVQAALRNLMRDRTSIVIAHRLSTITHADKIVVLDQGRIVGVGGHEELLQSNAHYRALFQAQFQAVE